MPILYLTPLHLQILHLAGARPGSTNTSLLIQSQQRSYKRYVVSGSRFYLVEPRNDTVCRGQSRKGKIGPSNQPLHNRRWLPSFLPSYPTTKTRMMPRHSPYRRAVAKPKRERPRRQKRYNGHSTTEMMMDHRPRRVVVMRWMETLSLVDCW